jgi:16S rRNA (adenine1518-N6/adenine1519-N6)-dimethyltransferase
MTEDGLPPLRDVITQHGLRADKRFGQNFILDLNLTRRIARTAGDIANCDVLEIGPGPGGLTRGLLLEGARKVTVIEADRRFIPALEEIAAHYPGRLDIIHGDALKISPESITDQPYRIVSNLPYNVATPLVIDWLQSAWREGQWQPKFLSLTLMFQKEVAQRLVAQPEDRAYGRLGVLAGWLTYADIVFEVDRQAFVPPPKVTSAIVQLTPRKQPLAPANPQTFEKLTAAAFGQRRKMLRASLKQICLDPHDLLARAGVKETARAEEIPIEAFCTLARLLDEAVS